MASTRIARAAVIDDDGSGRWGSVYSPSVVASLIYDAIDGCVSGTLLNLGGGLVVAKQLITTGVLTAPQLTANQNDYNPTNLAISQFVRFDSNAARTITGIQGGINGRMLFLHNFGTFVITIAHNSLSSAFLNRILCPGNVDYAFQPVGVIMLYYKYNGYWILVGG